MIKVRKRSGEVEELAEDVSFVEICDREGSLAAVVFATTQGILRVVSPGDEDFSKYVKAYTPKVTVVLEQA